MKIQIGEENGELERQVNIHWLKYRWDRQKSFFEFKTWLDVQREFRSVILRLGNFQIEYHGWG
jgi:hypothetical protein